MKAKIRIALVGIFLTCFSLNLDAAAFADSTKSKTAEPKAKKKRFITFGYARNVDILELYPGRNFKHSHVFGRVKLDETGVRFTPNTEAPEGVNEEVFKTA